MSGSRVLLPFEFRSTADAELSRSPGRPGAPATEGSAPPKVVELVGLPGVGKSTLVARLTALGAGRAARVQPGRLSCLPLLTRNAVVLSHPFARQFGRIRSRRWSRFRMMVHLRTLEDLVSRRRTQGLELVLFDQGPIYLLTGIRRAREVPEAGGDSRAFDAYWNSAIKAWAAKLTCVVLMEADDEVLYRRIMRRGKDHRVVGMDQGQVAELFERHRRSAHRILDELTRHGGPKVVRVRTDRWAVDETALRVLAEIRLVSR